MKFFLDNKYTNWYFSIISKARTRVNNDYIEKHHIIPKSIGGLNTKDNLVELSTNNLFKNREDCIEAIIKKAKENISKKYEKLIDDDYSYFLKNDSNIKQTSLIRNDSSEIKTDTESPEVFRGEKGLEGTKGPSLSKEEWERISAAIYGFASTELNLKRP